MPGECVTKAKRGPHCLHPCSPQYVATIPGAFVEGDSGLVYDTRGRVYHLPHLFYNRTSTLLPMPQRSTQQARLTPHYPRPP